MADSSLGDVSFVSLCGIEAPSQPPPTLREMVMAIQRHGVEGTAFVLLGSKGVPFFARGFAVFEDRTEAEAADAIYKAMIGADKYNYVWGGNLITSCKYVVLDVRLLRVQTVGVSSSGHGAIAESLWTLCAVSDD